MPITLEDIQAFIYRGEVANYSALPSAASVPNSFYWVQASQGTKYIGVLWGGSYYPAGTYHSNGVSWEYMDTPSQATQSIVDTGTDTERYITSKLFNDSAQLASKASLTGTETLTNKRITQRVSSITSSATPTPNADTDDEYTITALAAAALLTNPTGTPTEGQSLLVRIKDNGTARALTFDTQYRFSSDQPAPTTTVIGKTLYMGFVWNSDDSKWDCLGYINNI